MTKFATLFCLNGTPCSPLEIPYDPATGLMVPALAAEAAASTLSAISKPVRRVRWTDSLGNPRIDLGAVFDNERASASQSL